MSTVEIPDNWQDMVIIDAFTPPDSMTGKEFKDLTEEEKKVWLDKYRFSGYRPGVYQGITFRGSLPL